MAKKKTNTKEKETTKKAAPKKAAPKKVEVKLDPNKKHEIEGLGKDGLIKGKSYIVTAEIATILIEKGSAKIKS